MPYKQEQVERAKEWLLSGDEYDKEHATCILAALEAAEKRNDYLQACVNAATTQASTALANMKTLGERVNMTGKKLDSLTAYVTALEKAGDGMFGSSAADFDKACDSWDAARKAKP